MAEATNAPQTISDVTVDFTGKGPKITPQIATKELGRTGLIEYSGHVYEEQLRQLASFVIRTRIFREMSENDSVIGAMLFAIQMLIRQVDWRVQAGGKTNEDLRARLFVEECMRDMSTAWPDIISEILSFLIYGWSFHEIVYKVRDGSNRDPARNSRFTDGLIGWRKLPIRAQETLWTWIFDREGGIQAMRQQPPPDYQFRVIPIEKALLFRTTIRKNNPEGQSILRTAYRTWYFKKRIETYEAIGVERELAGYPVVYVPAEWTDVNATEGEKNAYAAMKQLVTNIRRDEQEGVILPSIFDDNNNQLVKLELLTSGGKRNFDTNVIINRLDQRLAMTVMADFVLLGTATDSGSYALSSDKTKMFSMAIKAWMNMIASVFSKFAIPRLFEINNWRLEKYPTLNFSDVETPNLDELGNYIQRLSKAGITFNDEEFSKYVRQAANIPIVDKREL